jgi:hypothetical protein
MVVEEVTEDPKTPVEEKAPLEEVKEKVEELQDITEDMSENIEKSEEVQEEIAEAVEEVSDNGSSTHELQEDQEEKAEDIKHDHQHVPVQPEESRESLRAQFMSEEDAAIKNPTATNPLVVIIPGIFLLGALLGGIYFYQKGTNLSATETPAPTATAVANASAVPSAAPTTSIDLTKYPVNVLNGSGIAGEAGRAKTLLTGGGFTVSATGNATSYDFTKTIIKAKSDVPEAFLTKLTETLGKTYSLDKNQTLPASSADAVQVIVGSTKAK